MTTTLRSPARSFDTRLDRFEREARPAIARLVRATVRDEDLAAEMEQEVVLSVLRALPSYDESRPLIPWVQTIARNRLRDHWRSTRYRPATNVEGAERGEVDPLAALEAQEAQPDSAATAVEERELVRSAVEGLPPTLRDVVRLRAFEGLSFDEVANRLDRTAVAVRKRYSRALEALRERLAHWIHPDHPAGTVCDACPPA